MTTKFEGWSIRAGRRRFGNGDWVPSPWASFLVPCIVRGRDSGFRRTIVGGVWGRTGRRTCRSSWVCWTPALPPFSCWAMSCDSDIFSFGRPWEGGLCPAAGSRSCRSWIPLFLFWRRRRWALRRRLPLFLWKKCAILAKILEMFHCRRSFRAPTDPDSKSQTQRPFPMRSRLESGRRRKPLLWQRQGSTWWQWVYQWKIQLFLPFFSALGPKAGGRVGRLLLCPNWRQFLLLWQACVILRRRSYRKCGRFRLEFPLRFVPTWRGGRWWGLRNVSCRSSAESDLYCDLLTSFADKLVTCDTLFPCCGCLAGRNNFLPSRRLHPQWGRWCDSFPMRWRWLVYFWGERGRGAGRRCFVPIWWCLSEVKVWGWTKIHLFCMKLCWCACCCCSMTNFKSSLIEFIRFLRRTQQRVGRSARLWSLWEDISSFVTNYCRCFTLTKLIVFSGLPLDSRRCYSGNETISSKTIPWKAMNSFTKSIIPKLVLILSACRLCLLSDRRTFCEPIKVL